jgi:hypothetical protein
MVEPKQTNLRTFSAMPRHLNELPPLVDANFERDRDTTFVSNMRGSAFAQPMHFMHDRLDYRLRQQWPACGTIS